MTFFKNYVAVLICTRVYINLTYSNDKWLNSILILFFQEVAAYYAAQQHGTANTAEDIAKMLIKQQTRNTAELMYVKI